LAYYAVHEKGLSEADLRTEMQKNFGVGDFDDMTERDYIVTRRYLQNLAQ
jgi:hypothetical protein